MVKHTNIKHYRVYYCMLSAPGYTSSRLSYSGSIKMKCCILSTGHRTFCRKHVFSQQHSSEISRTFHQVYIGKYANSCHCIIQRMMSSQLQRTDSPQPPTPCLQQLPRFRGQSGETYPWDHTRHRSSPAQACHLP